MPLLHLLVWVAGHHVIPAFFASVWIGLGLVLIFYVARVRRAAHRVAFLYAALLKAGLALWTGESLSCLLIDPYRLGFFGFSLPHFLPGKWPGDVTGKAIVANSYGLAAVVIGVIALVLLIYRWSRVAPVYRQLARIQQAPRRDFAEVIAAFDELVARTFGATSRLPRPRLMILYGAPSPAFTMGARPPVVVLSAELASELAVEEVAGILAHEIGHIRRWDYLARWLATIFRDVMIWNPLVHLWYVRVLDLQEKASDAYAAKLVGDADAVASGLVEMGAYLSRSAPVSQTAMGVQGVGHDLRQLGERVDLLIEARSAPPPRLSWRDAVWGVVLVLFLLVQPHFVVSLPYICGVVRGWFR